MEHKPAGWYRNEDDRRQHGYWDGFAWVDPNPIDPGPIDSEPAVPADDPDDEPAEADDPPDRLRPVNEATEG